MQGDPEHARLSEKNEGKKRAAELGDSAAPRPFRRRGAYSIEREPVGASFSPAPRKEPSAGATMPAKPSISYLTLGQRHRHEPRRTAALHAHEHAVLVVGARGVDGLADVTGIVDALAGNFENHVAFLEAALGGRTLRV